MSVIDVEVLGNGHEENKHTHMLEYGGMLVFGLQADAMDRALHPTEYEDELEPAHVDPNKKYKVAAGSGAVAIDASQSV